MWASLNQSRICQCRRQWIVSVLRLLAGFRGEELWIGKKEHPQPRTECGTRGRGIPSRHLWTHWRALHSTAHQVDPCGRSVVQCPPNSPRTSGRTCPPICDLEFEPKDRMNIQKIKMSIHFRYLGVFSVEFLWCEAEQCVDQCKELLIELVVQEYPIMEPEAATGISRSEDLASISPPITQVVALWLFDAGLERALQGSGRFDEVVEVFFRDLLFPKPENHFLIFIL